MLFVVADWLQDAALLSDHDVFAEMLLFCAAGAGFGVAVRARPIFDIGRVCCAGHGRSRDTVVCLAVAVARALVITL